MQEINKIREQVNSDIHAVNLRVIDIGKTTGLKLENIVPQVNDLQHKAEACALEVQSMRKNMPAHVIEDSKSWLGKLDDLDKKMQLNLSKTTSTVCNLQAKLDMNSILVSQLFEERSKSAKSQMEEKTRTRSRKKRDGSCGSRTPSLDVISENACREASPEMKTAPTHGLDSNFGLSGLQSRGGGVFRQSDEVRSKNITSRGFSPVREPSLSREFSTPLAGSRVPSRTATPMSTAPTTPQFRLLSSIPASTNVAPSASRGVPNSPGVSTRGVSPVRLTSPLRQSSHGGVCPTTLSDNMLNSSMRSSSFRATMSLISAAGSPREITRE